MGDDSRLVDLAIEWEERRRRGETPDLEELCRHDPELLGPLRDRVRILAAMDERLRETDTLVVDAGTGGPTADLPTPSAMTHTLRFVRFHARGGLGEVFEAEDETLGRHVALKRLPSARVSDPEARRRFLLEAGVTARLEHPGIVPVYGLGTDDSGRPFYAMRFIRGGTLAEAIEKLHQPAGGVDHDSVAFRSLLGRFVAVCNTIAYAHDQGVLHRDLKPANIMLGPWGETLVVDWGLARRFAAPEIVDAGAPEPMDSVLTQSGVAMGTPAYMSPEQALGRSKAMGPPTDIWGLGATLYAILTGRAPFGSDASSASTLPDRSKVEALRPPRSVSRDVPRALDAVCRRALSPEPADRYARAADLAADIERWLAGEAVTAWREPWFVRARRFVRRHRTAVAAIALMLLAGGAATSVSAVRLRSLNADLRGSNARAEENFRGVRDAVRQCLGVALRDELFRHRASHRARFEILQAALRWSGEFLARRGDDPALAAEAADARLLAAETLLTLDEAAEAESHIAAAVTLLAGPGAPAGAGPASLERTRARAESLLGRMYLKTNRPAEARHALERCVASWAAAGGDGSADVGRMEAETHLGEALDALGETEAALKAYERAAGLCETRRRDGVLPGALRAASVFANRGRAATLWKLDRRDEAMGVLAEARAIQEELCREFPDVDEHAASLAVMETTAGFWALMLSDPRTSLERHERAAAVLAQIVLRSPEGEAHRETLVTQHQIVGRLRGAMGDPAGGRVSLEMAIQAAVEGRDGFVEAPEDCVPKARLISQCVKYLDELPSAGEAAVGVARRRGVETAVRVLRRALAAGLVTRDSIAGDAVLEPLRHEPAFEALLAGAAAESRR